MLFPRFDSSLPGKKHRRHPEVLAVLHGEPRRMSHERPGPSFETPRKRAAPQDDGYVCGTKAALRDWQDTIAGHGLCNGREACHIAGCRSMS
jgi:hypothetical protein